MTPWETDEKLQKEQVLMPLGSRKLQTDSFKDSRRALLAVMWSIDLNDIVPFIDRPDTIVLHVGW